MNERLVIILFLLFLLIVILLLYNKNSIKNYILSGCTTNPDCSPGQVCLQSYCISPTCLTDVDCAVGGIVQYQTCITEAAGASGVCQPKPCSPTVGCSTAQACVNSQCLPLGETCSGSCYGGALKCLNSVCAACAANTDCANPTPICSSGICRACTTADTCPGGTTCLSNGTCGNCNSNTDCPNTLPFCVQNTSGIKTCQSCSWNPNLCLPPLGQTCLASGACGTCSATAACPSGTTCTNGNCVSS